MAEELNADGKKPIGPMTQREALKFIKKLWSAPDRKHLD